MKTKLFIIFFLSLAIIGCNEQAKQNLDVVLPDTSVDENADVFARILSSSMNNPDMLDFIKEKSEERFDGDENFLIMDKIDEKATKSSKTFYEMLSSVATKSDSSYDLDTIIEEIMINDPLLQIYVMNSELWGSGIEPLVVLLPDNYDDERECTLNGYKMSGETFTFSSEDEIDDAPVVVISRNERTIAVVKGEEDIFFSNKPIVYSSEKMNYYLKEDINNKPDDILATYSFPVTKNSGVNVPTDDVAAQLMGSEFQNCFRMINFQTKDYISKITMVDKGAWKAIESGWLGDPELRLHIVYAKRTSTGITLYRHNEYLNNNKFGNRNNIKTYDWNEEIMQWSLGNNGHSMTYAWNEEDNSDGTKDYYATYSIKIVVDNQVLTYNGMTRFDVGNEDNDAGESYVYYIDPVGSSYSDYVKFWITPKSCDIC